MFNHESRYHVNQINTETSANSVGITQLIDAWNTRTQNYAGYLGDVRNEINRLKNSNNAACKQFSEHYDTILSSTRLKQCQLIHPSKLQSEA
ncbi:MAG: hypothetical protein R2827_13170 [Bdellovibrionales bacterium]